MNTSSESERVIIFDTTLRDGEQSPRASMTMKQKLEIAHALKELGVDVIEAGFPIASPDDFAAVAEIAAAVQGPTIAALARANEKDIVSAGEALQGATNRRIHTFLATSPIHREFKLKMTKEQILHRTDKHVRLAKTFTDDVEFSPEDAGRTELEYLTEIVTAAIEAGATTINIPDTVGYCTPEQYAAIFRHLKNHVPTIDQVILSAHCHDDLGLAVANTLAAIGAGARQAEVTVNGIGERAGNARLEAVVMALHIQEQQYGVRTNIKQALIVPTSRLVQIATWAVQPNSAIVGRNAFAHESGIHQHGMMSHPDAYEIMRPESVGWDGTEMVLGKHSGKAAVIDAIKKLGMPVRDEHVDMIMTRFKAHADTQAVNKKYVPEEELLDAVYFPAIIEATGGDAITDVRELGRVNGCITVEITTADKCTIIGTASTPEEGLMNAMQAALKQIMSDADIPEHGFTVETTGSGSDAMALASITMANAHAATRTARHANTETASVLAQIAAFNSLMALNRYEHA